jgi:hypothetical protein
MAPTGSQNPTGAYRDQESKGLTSPGENDTDESRSRRQDVLEFRHIRCHRSRCRLSTPRADCGSMLIPTHSVA